MSMRYGFTAKNGSQKNGHHPRYLDLPVAARPVPNRYRLNEDVVGRIFLERLRQKDLLKHGKIKFDLASPIVSHDRKLRVITEELGEVARAIDDLENAVMESKTLAAKMHLRLELNQLAACTIAWLEALEEELK